MADPADAGRYRRRLLRLGALLFQLQYYMQEPSDIAARIYRRDTDTYIQVVGKDMRFVDGAAVETMSLEAAITRCKEALNGATLRQPDG